MTKTMKKRITMYRKCPQMWFNDKLLPEYSCFLSTPASEFDPQSFDFWWDWAMSLNRPGRAFSSLIIQKSSIVRVGIQTHRDQATARAEREFSDLGWDAEKIVTGWLLGIEQILDLAKNQPECWWVSKLCDPDDLYYLGTDKVSG